MTPNKYELARFLVNLDTLIRTQLASGGVVSVVLKEEYDRNLVLLEAAIKEDSDAKQERKASSDYGSRRTQSSVREEGRYPSQGGEGV